MTFAYGSSGSFGSRERSKYIGNKKYTGRRSIFHSKPTPIYEPVHRSYLNYSYSRSHFSRLLQEVAKKPIYCLYQKVSYASKIIDPIINGFNPNDVSSNLQIFDHSIFTFGIREKCLGLSNTSHVDSLYRFRISVFDKVKQIYAFKKTFKRK